MKKIIVILVALGVAVGVSVSVWYFREAPKLNTEQVESVFLLSAEEAQINAIEKAIMAFQQRDPQTALAGFTTLLADKNLTDEQKAVVKDLMNQVNKYLGKPVDESKP
jgi:predicted negative regulator of RcsB-dependent stress response